MTIASPAPGEIVALANTLVLVQAWIDLAAPAAPADLMFYPLPDPDDLIDASQNETWGAVLDFEELGGSKLLQGVGEVPEGELSIQLLSPSGTKPNEIEYQGQLIRSGLLALEVGLAIRDIVVGRASVPNLSQLSKRLSITLAITYGIE